jgi:uncharacterized protein YgiM (DUF1202 family)
MKKLLVILVTVIGFNAMAQDNPSHLNVLAVNGLNMRSQPESKSRVVTKVPYGKQVEILEKTDNQLQLGWVQDKWYKVRFRGREGYIFGGYLSKLNAPVNSEKPRLLSDLLPMYCSSAFKMDSEPIISKEASRSRDTLYHTLLRFNHDAELELERSGNRETATLLLPNSIQETYVLLEALLKESGNSQLLDELRFIKDKDGMLSRISHADGSILIKALSSERTALRMTDQALNN